MQWSRLSLGEMSRVSSPVVVVGHSPVLAGGLLSRDVLGQLVSSRDVQIGFSLVTMCR